MTFLEHAPPLSPFVTIFSYCVGDAARLNRLVCFGQFCLQYARSSQVDDSLNCKILSRHDSKSTYAQNHHFFTNPKKTFPINLLSMVFS